MLTESDPRVLWWGLFNEPHMMDSIGRSYSSNLTHAAYGWAKKIDPKQLITSLWT